MVVRDLAQSFIAQKVIEKLGEDDLRVIFKINGDSYRLMDIEDNPEIEWIEVESYFDEIIESDRVIYINY
jgi:hypothetical protein